ncbi:MULTISPECIES: nitric oxide-sensing protein NosP [unclassified Halomonas]|uniref:nitric oxide-sensing protein NosP n=1 Tax=unclassified Halomonas TaxID=2609666 RepID=UPI0009909F7B|nr:MULTISPECIES: nitric oxide-sensing protein NosP [unclassified Halomonas]AQU82626.1 FIST domain containing protein [Halomonas sp. 'Soap Lake \
MSSQIIRTAHSSATEARQAVAEFHAAVVQQDMAVVIFFCSSEYDLDVLAAEMNQRFSGVQVVGCTTAGEIGPAGYLQHTLTGASFPADSNLVVSGLLEDLSQFEISRAQSFVQTLLQRLESNDPKVCLENRFALLMIDGMSSREEPAAHALQYALGKIPLFGGSAGDDQKFVRTYVFSNGKFHADSAVLVLVNTAFPFMTFKTQHFIPTEERMVVTEADLSERIVKEINGLPAAEEYARMLGVRVDELNPMRFAASPVVVMIAGTNYVRSIQQVNSDGSLTLYSAIEEGLVLRVAHGAGLVSNLEQTFDKIHAEVGHPQLVIGCDCILRKLEVVQNGLQGRIAEIFKDNNTIGFNSYGEQFHGIHVNQTLTGVAIGSARTGTDV